ncbi:MAG: response regulator transcription factor [Leptospiraceae bacterium]|nr:response regulator transcription factor [Leptospiraceae bacterium]
MSSARVVLIDDDYDFLTETAAVLRDAGMQAHICERSSSAFRQVRYLNPDAVLLDLDMPHVSGFQVLKQLRGASRTEQIPVLLLTAHDNPPIRIRGFEQGLDDFISKPFTPRELVLRLHAVIRRYDRRQTGICGFPTGPAALGALEQEMQRWYGSRAQARDDAIKDAVHESIPILRLLFIELTQFQEFVRTHPDKQSELRELWRLSAHRIRQSCTTDCARFSPVSLEPEPGLVLILPEANRIDPDYNQVSAAAHDTGVPEPVETLPLPRLLRSINRGLRSITGGHDFLASGQSGLVTRPAPDIRILLLQISGLRPVQPEDVLRWARNHLADIPPGNFQRVDV